MKTHYNTLIIGTGCAGYNAADRLFSLGVTDIAIVTEGRLMGTSRNTGSDKQTYYKLSLAGFEGDSVRDLAKTLFNGGAVNGDTALAEAAYSVRSFMHLVELGVPFPANEYGEYVGYKTDHDPKSRATSCGPLTSKLMTEALEKSVMSKNIPILDRLRVIKLLLNDNKIAGIAAITPEGELCVLGCDNVILATGGPAGIYKNSVYPESQTGASGLALEAGAEAVNLEEWQYGLASTGFRWNVSGSYQQVLPRFISVDKTGEKREFLYDTFGEKSLDLVFLKGYQWPFDTAKLDGSSAVDIAVNREILLGRRVYMDFTENPCGLEEGFTGLSDETYNYLKNSDILFGTPIERLEKLNRRAIELYAAHGIDLYHKPLEVAVCAQHSNGGIAVDENWQTTIPGLYCAGEAAGTFGVARPGGSALNSTQVGSLRAAEHIARTRRESDETPDYSLPDIWFGKSNLYEIQKEYRLRMSEVAAFIRDADKMKALYADVCRLCENYFTLAIASDKNELTRYFIVRDMLTTQRAVLSAMIFSAENIGTHGSALVSGSSPQKRSYDSLTVTLDGNSFSRPVRPLPDPDLWFETVWNRQNK